MSDVLVLNADGSPLSVLPMSIVNWQVAIRLLTLGKVKPLKDYDDWVIRSQFVTLNVPSIVMCTDYVRFPRHIKYSRANVFMRDNYTCQLQSTYKCKKNKGKGHNINDLTLDHVVPKSHAGGTTWTNVTTACSECNGKKGNDKSIVPKNIPFKPSYYQLMAKRRALPITIKDPEWSEYLQWDDELVNYHPRNVSKSTTLTEYKNRIT